MSDVHLNAVVKNWGTTRAVDRVSLHVNSGELVALLGPSGCGKSTTLRLIAGLEAADEGEIHIGGRDVTRLPPAQRGVAMVFQSYALFPHLTVAENIVFGLQVRRAPVAERKRRLDAAAELLGLGALLDRRPAQLSGGQRQRVALGRAIVAEAAVCLMDEPLSNLDAQLRQQMRQEIRALQQRLGMTLIYVTHDQTEAMTMADKVVLMRAGRIEQHGSPAELYERPASTFVAGFIGCPAMNLLPGAAARAGDPADSILIGVRPEHIALCEPGRGLPAQLETIEYLGAESMLICRHDDAHRITVRMPGRVTAGIGERVGLVWPTDAEHRFARDHGRRVAGT
ncbi:sn-glycerol 3-phosphate ABC transporter ATP binding subunit [Thauera humireducens]|uniref:ABC transporter ATP-binding protein n=1 Tax=Thauera humireducens TaxID=1134435 RepID=UPI002467A525|nr:ABC transporter ATP-binding protein [Thauera humireducens]CAH1747962.1 sn-glycerol 3-phosphate ABC transporter ATP binding subunit [Thauera humireducens]